jgi:hypothetical protein
MPSVRRRLRSRPHARIRGALAPSRTIPRRSGHPTRAVDTGRVPWCRHACEKNSTSTGASASAATSCVCPSSALRDAGRGGWGAAATAASAALGVAFFVHITLSAALAYSIAGSGNAQITSGLNDLSWVLMVIASFPAAMLIMAGSFGLWRAGIISNAFFSAGVTAVVMVLLGATTWAGDGFWAPGGAYSRFVSPILALAWIAVVSGLLMRLPSTVSAPDRAAVPAA